MISIPEDGLPNPSPKNTDNEYQLFVDLTRSDTIEELDAILEQVFISQLDIEDAHALAPNNPEPCSPTPEGEEPVHVSSISEAVQDIVVGQPPHSSQRRFMDAALEVYVNHYELLVKSQIDKLTGLNNRQVLQDKISRLTMSADMVARRKNEPDRVVVLFDIDHFKKINDNYGHLCGDEILVLFAHMMKSAFRTDDWLFRYGGEEFLVFLNNIDMPQAKTVITRFLASVESHNFPQIGRVTCSSGFTLFKASDDFSTIFNRADKALYYAKDHGRNRVVSYQELIAKELIPPEDAGEDIEFF